MSILVTGATGLVGLNLCKRLLLEGHQVVGLLHNRVSPLAQTLLENGKFTMCVADIRDEPTVRKVVQCNRVETIFHLAARMPHSIDQDIFGVNVTGTGHLLKIAKESCVKEFVFASSMSVYSAPPKYLPVDEEHPMYPTDMYGISKVTGEYLCQCYSKHMQVTILRFAGIYGAGDTHNVVSALVQAALDGRPLLVHGDGNQSSDTSPVEDIVSGAWLAWTKGKGGVYNIGSGRETVISDLANVIVQLTNSKSAIVASQEVTTRPFRYVSSIDKAVSELGYIPTPYPQGLSDYIALKRKEIRDATT